MSEIIRKNCCASYCCKIKTSPSGDEGINYKGIIFADNMPVLENTESLVRQISNQIVDVYALPRRVGRNYYMDGSEIKEIDFIVRGKIIMKAEFEHAPVLFKIPSKGDGVDINSTEPEFVLCTYKRCKLKPDFDDNDYYNLLRDPAKFEENAKYSVEHFVHHLSWVNEGCYASGLDGLREELMSPAEPDGFDDTYLEIQGDEYFIFFIKDGKPVEIAYDFTEEWHTAQYLIDHPEFLPNKSVEEFKEFFGMER